MRYGISAGWRNYLDLLPPSLPLAPEWSPVVHSPIANAGDGNSMNGLSSDDSLYSEVDAIACRKYLPDSIKCRTSDSINVPALYDLVLPRSLRLSRGSMEEDITDRRMIMRESTGRSRRRVIENAIWADELRPRIIFKCLHFYDRVA